MGRIVVTGGAGLIGSVLGRKLLDAGHSLLVLDSFQYSYALIPSPDFRWDIDFRVNHLLQGARIERCSTIEAARMRALLEDFSPDCVIHLAAIPLVEVATRHRESAVGSLLTGLTNILEIVRSSNSVARFVYASSSMVYGNFDIDPMPETGRTDPINIYGGLKLAGEVLCHSYLAPTHTEPVIVRPSAVYGPTDQHRRVVQKFCENALDGLPIQLNHRNDHTMDFTYVDDAAHGFFLAATHPSAGGETFNITYGQGRRLSELAQVLKQYAPNLKLSGEEIDDHDRPRRGGLSTDKARRLLGYEPRWPLERGIPAYLEHLRKGRAQHRGAA